MTIVMLYLLGGIGLYIFQRSFIYFPTKKTEHHELIRTYNIQNEEIHVISLNQNKKNAIIYFGGRSEAVANNIHNFKKAFPNHAVYLVNYRGYGGSSGEPTETNLFYDAQFIYKEISKTHENISIIGRSLGTGVATYIAESREINKLVLVTPYDSILHMAQDKYPFYPISLILKDQYNSIQRVSNLKIPTLIFLAQEDKTIKSKYSNSLIQAFNPSVLTIKTIKDSGHKTIVEKEDYIHSLYEFFKEE